MKRAIVFLAGLGLGVILITGSFENSAAEEGIKSTTSDTLPANNGQIASQQSESSHKLTPKKKFSFKPGPVSECKSFLITEFGVFYGLDKSSDQSNLRLVTWELGLMENRNEHSAIGGTFVLAADPDGGASRLGLKARYRYWLTNKKSVDIAPGILFSSSKTGFEFPSFTCNAGLNLNTWFAVTGQVDIIRWESATKTEGYLGLKVGTPTGAGIATAALVVAALAITITFSGPMFGDGSF